MTLSFSICSHIETRVLKNEDERVLTCVYTSLSLVPAHFWRLFWKWHSVMYGVESWSGVNLFGVSCLEFLLV